MRVWRTAVTSAVVIGALAAGGGVAAAAPTNGNPPAPHSAPTAPQTKQQRDNDAINTFTAQVSVASTLGSLGGMAAGAGIGCAIGAGVGVVTTAGALSLPGCLTGMVTGAGVGSIVGTLAAGGPTLIGSGANLIATLSAPASLPAAQAAR